jgi:hypothetical protein
MLIDNDSQTSDGSTPDWLEEYIKLAKHNGISDPFMVITARENNKSVVIAIIPFPDEKGKAVEILKKHGG